MPENSLFWEYLTIVEILQLDAKRTPLFQFHRKICESCDSSHIYDNDGAKLQAA